MRTDWECCSVALSFPCAMTCDRILKLAVDLRSGAVNPVAVGVVQAAHTCPTDALTGFDSMRVEFTCAIGSDVMTLLATGVGAALQVDATTLRIRPTSDSSSLLVYVPSSVSSAALGKLAIGLSTQVGHPCVAGSMRCRVEASSRRALRASQLAQCIRVWVDGWSAPASCCKHIGATVAMGRPFVFVAVVCRPLRLTSDLGAPWRVLTTAPWPCRLHWCLCANCHAASRSRRRMRTLC